MTATSKNKSYYERILSKIDAKTIFREKQLTKRYRFSQTKIKQKNLTVKNVVAMNFMCPMIKVFHL